MKRNVLMVVVMLMFGILSFTGEAGADGYTNTVNAMGDLIQGAHKREAYIRYFCDSIAAGKPETNPGVGFGNSDNFDARIRSDMTTKFASRYPGSQINCLTGGGTWVDGKATYHFTKGMAYKMIYLGEWGLTDEYDIPHSNDSMIVRITDPRGNYVSISVDLSNPNNCRYIEAKLPINMQSSGIVVGDKGYQYVEDELVTAMNLIYRDMLLFVPNSTLVAYANELLINRDEREILIQQARKSMRR